jgi:hypothetical protein
MSDDTTPDTENTEVEETEEETIEEESETDEVAVSAASDAAPRVFIDPDSVG